APERPGTTPSQARAPTNTRLPFSASLRILRILSMKASVSLGFGVPQPRASGLGYNSTLPKKKAKFSSRSILPNLTILLAKITNRQTRPVAIISQFPGTFGDADGT